MWVCHLRRKNGSVFEVSNPVQVYWIGARIWICLVRSGDDLFNVREIDFMSAEYNYSQFPSLN